MRRTRQFVYFVLAGILLLSVLVFAWWRTGRGSSQTKNFGSARPQTAASGTASPVVSPTPGKRVASTATSTVPQASAQTSNREEALRTYVQHMMRDPTFEGWTPLNFYGQVLNDAGQPVTGATASLGWSTNGLPGGYSTQQVTSDAQGLFSLTGQHGKHLSVRVEKEGYYTVGEKTQGNFFFEYADPTNPDYYQPSEQHPVTFYLRRKGPGAVLTSKSLELALGSKRPQAQVNFLTGFIRPDGQLTIAVDMPDYRTARGRFPWSATLSIAQGGLIQTDEQFPFQAPTYGYAPSVRIDMTDTNLPTYRGNAIRTYYFYLQETNTYGHLTVDIIGANPTVDVSYVYNPKAGDRVLEPASKP